VTVDRRRINRADACPGNPEQNAAVPFYQHWVHADTLPMFRAMDAALAREVAGDHGNSR
jgi:hypothetical protein